MENIGILDVSGIGCCETRDAGFRIGLVNARMGDLEVLGQGVFGWRALRMAMGTVASERNDQMSETMIKNRNLPNSHLFKPFFYTRACHHPSSMLIYRRRQFFFKAIQSLYCLLF